MTHIYFQSLESESDNFHFLSQSRHFPEINTLIHRSYIFSLNKTSFCFSSFWLMMGDGLQYHGPKFSWSSNLIDTLELISSSSTITSSPTTQFKYSLIYVRTYKCEWVISVVTFVFYGQFSSPKLFNINSFKGRKVLP